MSYQPIPRAAYVACFLVMGAVGTLVVLATGSTNPYRIGVIWLFVVPAVVTVWFVTPEDGAEQPNQLSRSAGLQNRLSQWADDPLIFLCGCILVTLGCIGCLLIFFD